jgi:hypothetical protein
LQSSWQRPATCEERQPNASLPNSSGAVLKGKVGIDIRNGVSTRRW